MLLLLEIQNTHKMASNSRLPSVGEDAHYATFIILAMSLITATCGLSFRSFRLFGRALTTRKYCTADEKKKDGDEDGTEKELTNLQSAKILQGLGQNIMGNLRRPKARDRSKERDRRIPILWDVSIRYMESEAYKKAYGDFLVWQLFRRNRPYRFDIPGRHIRISCIGDDGFIQYGQPCPICRDEYLVLDYRNIKLLKQFIQPATQQVYPARKTNLCQKKHEQLLVEVLKAKDYGTLVYQLPFKQFDYTNYYTPNQLAGLKLPEEIDLADDVKLHEELGKPEFGEAHEYSYVDFP